MVYRREKHTLQKLINNNHKDSTKERKYNEDFYLGARNHLKSGRLSDILRLYEWQQYYKIELREA